MSVKSKTRVAAKVAEKEFLVPPRNVQLDDSQGGRFYHQWRVVMPEGFTLAMLNEQPGMWRLCMNNMQTGISKYDRLEIYTHNEEQFITAQVAQATPDKLLLSCIVAKPFAKIDADAGFNDGKYECRFTDGAWAHFRLSDNVQMSNRGYATLPEAKKALSAYYPVQVAQGLR